MLRGPLQALESVPSLCTYKNPEVPLDERSDGGRDVDINAPFANAFAVGLLQLGGILLWASDSELRFTRRELQPGLHLVDEGVRRQSKERTSKTLGRPAKSVSDGRCVKA